MAKQTAQQVFTPSSYPEHTYVQRSAQRLETTLAEALATPGQISSVVGPSKSGKTVLVEKVVGRKSLIAVSGAELRDSEDVWSRVLDWMGRPSQVVTADEQSQTMSTGLKVGGEAGEASPNSNPFQLPRARVCHLSYGSLNAVGGS